MNLHDLIKKDLFNMLEKKKILWLCSYPLTEVGRKSTGTWLNSMLEALLERDELEMYNISFGKVNGFTRMDYKNLTQWVVPHERPDRKGLASPRTIGFVQKLEKEIGPDLIHVWGTENTWGMLVARKLLQAPALLDIQGIVSEIAKVYTGGLTNKELVQCIGLKEILLPNRFLYFTARTFAKRGIFEKFVIRNFRHVSVQSEWVKSHIEIINPDCRIIPTGLLLRKEFYESRAWSIREPGYPVIFTSSSGSIPYKGLHVAFRALAVLKRKFPTIRLRVVGSIHDTNIRFMKKGYSAWLMREARKLGIAGSVEWLGALDAAGIVEQLQASDVALVTSYIESYCLALAEAMVVGVPSVASYAGAIPELGKHNESVLFFPVGDAVSCASQVEKILVDPGLATTLSGNARATGLERNNRERIATRQVQIYNQVLGDKLKASSTGIGNQAFSTNIKKQVE
ncbi:MAG TPA: glycosyltransferase [Paludibacter sp.]|nr:glycosyltransferase [Paludibacter sp.]